MCLVFFARCLMFFYSVGKSPEKVPDFGWKTGECGRKMRLPLPLLRFVFRKSASELYFPAAFFALKARAYMRICFCMDSKPLLRVGERWSRSPILSMK